MRGTDTRSKLISAATKDLASYQNQVSVTLNTLSEDEIKLGKYVGELMRWLRHYCFGRNFMQDELRLKAIGASEVGTFNQGLHMHLVIGYDNSTNRSMQDIHDFIKRKWYALHDMNIMTMKLRRHGLMDLRGIYHLAGSFKYSTKTIYYTHQFNLQYF